MMGKEAASAGILERHKDVGARLHSTRLLQWGNRSGI